MSSSSFWVARPIQAHAYVLALCHFFFACIARIRRCKFHIALIGLAFAAKPTFATTVATPTFSPVAGTYTAAQNVAISSTTSGASIRYTTDGSMPTSTTGTLYSAAVSITSTTTLKAIAYKSGYTTSVVTSGTYTLTAAAPTFSPAAGTYTSTQNVTIASATSGVSIRYTTDGSTPTSTTGTLYSTPVSIAATKTVKAIAYKTGYNNSSVTSGAYIINLPAVATPTFTPAAGTYTGAQTVTIGSSTSGANIRYTTDGSTPTASSGTLYSAPVTVGSALTLKAIAYESGYSNSGVANAAYTINVPVLTSKVDLTGLVGAQGMVSIVVTRASDSAPISNATVTLSVTSGVAQISTTAGGAGLNQISVVSNASGIAQGYVTFLGAAPDILVASIQNGTGTVSISIPVKPVPITLTGMRLWLRSTVGVSATGGAIGTWTDQSGNHNDASQSTPSWQPNLVGSQINGLPVAHFTQAQQSVLNLPNLMSGATAGEVFAVLRRSTIDNVVGLWAFGSAAGSRYPESNGQMLDDFGSLVSDGALAAPVDLTDFHIYNIAADGSSWTQAFNGKTAYSRNINTVSFSTAPTIGDGQGCDFDGDIAEIIIYDHVLTSAQREVVGQYLTNKYQPVGIAVPAKPSVVVSVISGTTVDLNWSAANIENLHTVATVERQTGAGAFTTIATITDGTTYTDQSVAAGQSYGYRVTLTGWAGSAVSDPVSVTTPSTSSLPQTGLRMWLRSTAGLVPDKDGLVSLWSDQSTNHNDASQSSAMWQPSVVYAQANGLPAVRFTQASQTSLDLPNLLSGASGGEIIAVLRRSTTSNIVGLWSFGGAGGSRYPEYNGQMLDDFGSTQSDGSATAPIDLTGFHIYDIAADASGWSQAFNGKVSYSRSGNTVNFCADPAIGDGQGCYFDGDIAEVAVYDHVLTPSQREAVGQYLTARYQPAGVVAPAKPIITASVVTGTTVDLNWSASNINGLHTVATLERQLGAGAYTAIATIYDGSSFTDLQVTAGNSYNYRVTLVGWNGTSPTSDPVAVTTPSSIAIPQTGLRLWLRTTAGLTVNGGLVSAWADQSTNHNDAFQPYSYWQPSLVTNQINGLDVVRFTQAQQTSLELSDFMAGATAGEVFAVVKRSTTSNVVGLWSFGSGAGSRYPEYTGQMLDDFASTQSDGVASAPITLTAFHIYNASGDSSKWTQTFNGKAAYTRIGNTPSFRENPSIGDGQGCFFDGDIAEIIVYDRVLTSTERDALNTYLGSRYTLALSTAAPTFTPAPGTYPSAQSVALSSTTSGASIAYTTDGTTPTESGNVVTHGTLYTAAVNVSGGGTIKAIAYKSGLSDSAVSVGTYTITAGSVATPTFSPVAGTYTSTQTVAINCATSDASIVYTTDGTAPAESGGAITNGVLYSGPISVDATMTVKAVAYKSGYSDSSVGSAAYTINRPVAAAPTFSPSAGTYASAQAVTIATATTGASIRYTTDGSTPTTTTGALYSGPISISSSCTLQAIAYKTGYIDSAIASGVFTLNIPVAAAPAFSPAAGTYTAAQSVAISTTTTGASIAYTTDGSTPTESGGTITHGSLYSSMIAVGSSSTLKAIAFKTGYSDSTAATAAYTINLPTAAAPTFSPIAGSYVGGQSVAISSATGGASIRYTTDGSTPTATMGTVYSGAVSISSSATVKAIAYETGYNNSSVSSAAYTIDVPTLVSLVDSTGIVGPRGLVSIAVKRASDNAPIANATVTMSVSSGISQISSTAGGTLSAQINVVSDASGTAQGFVTFTGSTPDTLVASVQNGSTPVSISIPIRTIPIDTTGLRLWLRSTVGVTTAGGSVSAWMDQSIYHNDASQSTPSWQPTLSSGQANGLPVLHFTQTSQSALSLPDVMSGATSGEVFAVLRRSSTASVVGLWSFGTGTGSRYPEGTGQMLDDFASNQSDGATSAPTDLTAFHIYNVAGDSATWMQAFNGNARYTRGSNAVGFDSAPMIGDGSGCYFDGDIAEVIIFDHVLTGAQRDKVGQYLTARYQPAGVPAPGKPTLNAPFVSSGAVDINWTGSNLANLHTVATLQRQSGSGSFVTIATLTDVNNYVDQTVSSGQSYTYQVSLMGWGGTVTSDPVSVTTPVSLSIPQQGLRLWLRSTAGVIANAVGAVSGWSDQSGNHNDASQVVSVNQPMLVNAQANGLPVVRFTQTQSTSLTLSNVMSGASGGEVFAVLRKSATQAFGGLWTLGGANGNAYPDSTGKFIEDFATTQGDGVIAAPVDVTGLHVYSVSGDNNGWNQSFNGKAYFSRSYNTSGFSAAPVLGFGQGFFDGDIAEIVMYDHVLTSVDRDAVNAYIAAKYSINLPVAAPTFTPSAGAYTAVQSVAIASATPGATIRYTLDGVTPTENYGIIYTGPIAVGATSSLQAVAYKTGLADSSVSTANYSINFPQASTPVFSLPAGSYATAQSVAITCANADATIRYTVDGSAPTETNGRIYSGPISISNTTVLKAIAYKGGAYTDSSAASALYFFASSQPAALDLLATVPPGVNGFAPNIFQGSDGNLYITNAVTTAGVNCVYKMASDANPVLWQSFPSQSHGVSQLIQSSDGTFYGVSTYGGSSGYGTIFSVTSAGLMTNLAEFNGTNGSFPFGRLAKGSDGNFYGTTQTGGSSNQGTIFKISPDGVLTTLVSFNGANGCNPTAPLILAADGSFYGTAGCTTIGTPGIVFRITSQGSLNTVGTLVSGVSSQGLLQASDGNFYGIVLPTRNQTGFGSVFRMTPAGTVTVLHDFGSDSENPGSLIFGQDGLLYGLTGTSDGYSNYGSVFQMTLSGDYTTVAKFDGANGSFPDSIIQVNDGTFYIATRYTGAGVESGIFKLTLPTEASIPKFGLTPGVYTGTQSLALSSSTPGASIAYTLDSSTPTESNGVVTHGTLYTGAISVTQNSTVKAIAFKAGIVDSMVVSASYVINNPSTVASPIYMPVAGTYVGAQSIAISSGTSGALIAYTTDGSSPTESGGTITHGTLYTGAITVAASETLKAVAFKSGLSDSPVIPALFMINAVAPTLTPAISGSVYENAQSVTLSTGTNGASIAYTLDGTIPTEVNGTVTNGSLYTVPLNLNTDGVVLNAIAFKSGLGDSQVASAIYRFKVDGPVFNPYGYLYYSSPQSVQLSTTTLGASIAYTVDGTAPIVTDGIITHGILYKGAIRVDSNSTIVAVGFAPGYANSVATSDRYVINLSPPVFTPSPRTYSSPQTVSIYSELSNAVIAYTLDGSVPTVNQNVLTHGTVYTGPITISASTAVKAIAFASTSGVSSVASGDYTINAGPGPVGGVTFLPAAGVYPSAQTVTLNSTSPDASIRYTTDGSIPTTTNGILYTVPILISVSTNINAIAYAPGLQSSTMTSAEYTIGVPRVAMPVFSVADADAHSVAIASITPGSAVRYTLDGSTPSETNGTVYSGPIVIAGPVTLKAIAFKSGFSNSSVASTSIAIPTATITNPANGASIP